MRADMVFTYYVKPFRTGCNSHNGILMSLLLLIAETKMKFQLFGRGHLVQFRFLTERITESENQYFNHQ